MVVDSDKAFVAAIRKWMEAIMNNSMQGFMEYTRTRGVSVSQIRTLLFVHHHGGSGLSALGEQLGISNAAASQMIDRLVQSGYADRHADEEDRRAIRIDLTKLGHELAEGATQLREQWVTALARDLTEAELAEATRVIENLAEHTIRLQGGHS